MGGLDAVSTKWVVPFFKPRCVLRLTVQGVDRRGGQPCFLISMREDFQAGRRWTRGSAARPGGGGSNRGWEISIVQMRGWLTREDEILSFLDAVAVNTRRI